MLFSQSVGLLHSNTNVIIFPVKKGFVIYSDVLIIPNQRQSMIMSIAFSFRKSDHHFQIKLEDC